MAESTAVFEPQPRPPAGAPNVVVIRLDDLGLGFERYYGFLNGDTNQWTPELVRDNGFVEPPRTPQNGYHLSEDLADTAIRMIQDQQQATPAKPFFLYFAPGATHAPHQAPPA